MEREGPQSTEGRREPPPQANVVQFGDWIGPREELVPFGRRQRTRATERSDERPPQQLGLAPSDTPPSADDFWGERAAAIHDALQGPALAPAPAGADGAVGAEPPAAPAVPGIRGAWNRRLVAGGACLLAVALLTGVALALNLLGAGAARSRPANGPKLALASVLSNGVADILRLDVPRIAPAAHRSAALLAAHRSRRPRKASHPHSASERVRYTAPARKTPTASFHASATASTARVAPAGAPPTVTSDANSAPASTSPPPPPTSRPTSSSAAVSATGQSGALGPIQSPNG